MIQLTLVSHQFRDTLLDYLLTKIQKHLEDDEGCYCKMHTIHSYKTMENNIIKIHNDIDILNEKNFYYVALTRGIKNSVG